MDEHICQECGKTATQQCPVCIKHGLTPAYFCSKECFTKSYKTHKSVHPVEQSEPKIDRRFDGFKFTGSLRPGVVSPLRKVPSHIARPEYADTGIPAEEAIVRRTPNSIDVRTEEEIKAMRIVGKIGREVLDIAGKAVKVGITTDEIDRIVHEAIIERNAYPSPLNYRNYPKSICSSVNEIICHGIPDSRPLQDGDIVNIDVSVYYGGFHTDLNETYLVGNVDEIGQKLVNVCRESLDKAIAMVKPGALYRDIGTVISKHVQSNGFSVVRSYCGHGVGKLFHTNPSIPHYGKNKAVGTMKPGHVFTIEPMINEGSYVDVLWPDDWTSSTKDGKRSAQFEHTLLVTDSGCEVLTKKID